MNRFGVLFIDDEIELIEIQYGKAVIHCQLSGTGRQAFTLIFRRDDNLKLSPAVNMVYFDKLHQARVIAIKRNDKTAFALIVDVFIVKIAQLDLLPVD